MSTLPTPHEVALEYPKPTDERDQRLLVAVVRGIVQADRERIAKVVEEMNRNAERDPVRMLRAGKMIAYDAILAILRSTEGESP